MLIYMSIAHSAPFRLGKPSSGFQIVSEILEIFRFQIIQKIWTGATVKGNSADDPFRLSEPDGLSLPVIPQSLSFCNAASYFCVKLHCRLCAQIVTPLGLIFD